MATQEDILAPTCETTKQGGEAKDPVANILLNKLPNKEKTQTDQLHELPETLESNFDLMHVKEDIKNSEQTFEGEQILGSPSITEASCDAYTVPPGEILKVNCKTADPQVIHTEKTEEAVEQKQEGLECVSKVVSKEEVRESDAVKASFNNDTDAASAVIYESNIENEDLMKPGLTVDIQCTGNTLLGLEAEAEKHEDIKVTTSSQSKEPAISLEVRNVIADTQQILDEKIVDYLKAETFENVAANVCDEKPENNSPVQVDEHYQKKTENPSLSENAECTLLEEEPSESTHVVSEESKAFTLSHTNETNDYFEDEMLNAKPREILDDKTEVKPIGEASIKEGTLQLQRLATTASNEDIKESEKAPLFEHSTGLTHADLSETLHEVKIADEKIREDEHFHSEKNLEIPLLKKETQQEKPTEYLQEAKGNIKAAASGQDIDAACSFKDESLTENRQETPSGKAEETTANVIDEKEETLDIQNASISDEKESLIGVDDSEKKSEELLVEAKIENAESKKPELHESPLIKAESQTEKCVESIQIALENPLASDSTQSIDTTSCIEENGLIADSQRILYEKVEDKATDTVEMEQSVEAHDTALLSNEESKEKLLIQLAGSQSKNTEHFEMEAEKPCLVETSTRDIEIGDEHLNKVELLVNEGNAEWNLVKEHTAEEKLVKSFLIAKEMYKVSSQDKEVGKEDRHENSEECLQVVPQDDKVLIQEKEEARNIVEEKILSLCLESDKEKEEVVEVVESLHVAHEDDKPLSSDMEVEKELEGDMVADSLNTAKDDIGLSQDTEVAKEAAAEENLVETLHVAYVADKALNPDLEVVNEVAYEKNFSLVDPKKNKSSSQDDLAKEENTAQTSYTGLKKEKLEAEHEKLVESLDVVIKHDKTLVLDTEVTKKVDVKHVAESKAVPDKVPSQETEASKKETEQKNDAMSSQEEKANDEQKLEEILYVASEAHKSLCPEAEVGKREETAATPTESLNVVFEDDGNQETEVAEEGKAVDPSHVTHEDAKVLSQEAQVSITQIEEAKHVESLKPAEVLNVVFENDGSKVAVEEKSVESLLVAHEDAKALSQEAEVSIRELEEAKPVECLKPTEFLNIVSEDDGNQMSKVAEEEKSVKVLHVAHEDAKALSQEAEVSIKKIEEAKHVESLKPTELLNVVSEDQRSKIAEEGQSIESLCAAHEDAKASSQEAEVSVTQIEEAKSVESLKPAEFLNVVSEDDGNQRSKVAEEEKSVESLLVAHEDAKALSQEAEVSVTQIEEAKFVEFLNLHHKDDDEGCQDTNIAKVEVKEDKSEAPFYVNEELSQDYSTKEDHKHTLGSDEVTIDQSKEANKVMEDSGKSVKDIELHMSDNQQHLTTYSEPLRQDTEVTVEIEEVKLGKSLHVPLEDNKELCLDNQVAKEGVEDKLAESFHIAKEGEKIVEPSCVAPEDDKEISTDISTKEPHSRTVESHEGTDYQSKETSDEVQKDRELIVEDKDIDLEMEDNLHVTPNAESLSQDKEAEIEEVEEVKSVASLHEPSEDDKELCLDNQVVQEAAKYKLVESAPEDENASSQDIKVAMEEQKSEESLCLALEDDREINTSVSTDERQNDALGSHEAGKDQGKETIDKKDLETVIDDKNIASQMTDILLSQDREVVLEDIKVEETKDVESLHETSQNKEQCPDNQAAKEATKDQHLESILVAHVYEKVINEDTKVPKEEGGKSTEPLCVAEAEKKISADISIKDPQSSRLGLSEAIEDQIKETKDMVKKDPEIIVKDEDSDLTIKDRLQDVPHTETLSQDGEVAIEKVEEVKPIESLHVASKDDKTLWLDNQVAEDEKEAKNKLVEPFHVTPTDKRTSNQEIEIAKQEGEKSTEFSCVPPEDDEEISTDISEKEALSNILDSDEAAEDQNKEIDEEEQKDPESTVKSKDIDLKITDNLDNITLCSEPSSQDLEAAIGEVEELKHVASLHVPSEDDKQMCPDNQVAKEEIDDKLVESFLVAPVDKNASNEDGSVAKGEKFVESSCVTLDNDQELSTDISIKEPHRTTLESHEAAEEQSKETNVEVKDCEIIVKKKNIDLKMSSNLQSATSYSESLSQDRLLTIEEEEVKPLESLHVPPEDDKTMCLDVQAAAKYTEDKIVESFHVAPEDKRTSNKEVSNVGEKDDNETSTDISTREPHDDTLGSYDATKYQIKERNDEKDLETLVEENNINLQMKDNLQHVTPYSESASQEQEVAMEEIEEMKLVESLHIPSEDDKEICLENQVMKEGENKLVESFYVALAEHTASNQDSEVAKEKEKFVESSCVAPEDKEIMVEENYGSMVLGKGIELLSRDEQHVIPSPEAENQVAGDEKDAKNKLVESFYVTPTDKRTSNQDIEVAKQEGEKSTESSCVAAEDDRETSRDISEKEAHSNILDSDEAAEDQNTEIDEEKDPESTVKSRDIDLKMTDNQDNITLCSEPSSQDLEVAIEVEELKPVASLHVPSEDDKEMCQDNQIAQEIHAKLVESFLVAPEDKNASNRDASVVKGEKLVEPSGVALDDDKELSTDISIEELHRTTLESYEAAEEQSKETNDEVKDCEIIVEDKDINLKMTDNLQSATSYSGSLSQDPVLTMEEVEEVKPLESLHVPPEDDKTSYLEIQAAVKYAEDEIMESFRVAPEDKRTSNTEVLNVGEKNDNETSTDIFTREPHDDALGSYDATEYQIKETNDEKDLETVVEEKNIDWQMKDSLQHVTPYSESSSQEQEVTMKKIEEMKLVESLRIPAEDNKEICLENQVMKEGENQLVESFHVAHVEQKASNQDSEVAKEKEKFVESSCVDIPHNKLGSCEPPEDQSKETNNKVQKDPETIFGNKDIEFHLTDHVISQDRDILKDEVEKVMLVESLHVPRKDDKEVCTDNEIAKEYEAEDKLVEPFHVAFDGKTSIQDTVVSIERENVAESSCPAFEDDREIRTDTTLKEPHNSKLSSDEAAEDQIKEINDTVQKDPETTAMDKDIKLLVKDNSQNITPKAESLDQEQEVATEEEKVMPVESLPLPFDDDKELCPENVAKEEQEEDKLGQSFDDEKESNPDSIAANKSGEESDESSCVAVEDSKKKSQDISTIDPHNKIFVSPEEAKEQSKEANEEVEDNYGSIVLDKDIELQLRDDQHVIPSPEALSQDTGVLTEEIDLKPRECLTELSDDGKESSPDKGEEKLAGSFYVAPEDDKASRQEMKEVSEQGEEEKPTRLSHIALEDCRTLNQEINDEVQDPETTAKNTNIDLQITDNRSITPYSETATGDEAPAIREIKEFEGKSPDGNIEKDFNEIKIEEKPAINIPVQEETCQKIDVTDNFTQGVSPYSDEKNNFLVLCIEDEKKSTELNVEVPEKIGSADSNVKTTKMNEEKGYLQDLQTITAVNIATHEEKAIELEDVTRPETESSDVSHEQVGLSVLEVSEEQPHVSHEKIEEPHVSHSKDADVTSIVPDIPKEKTDLTSTGKISCKEEPESEEMELFGDELSRIAANKSLEEADSKNEERELEVTTKPVKEEDQTETVNVINASLEEDERSRDFSKQIIDSPESIPVDLKAKEQGGKLEVTRKPVEEEEQTEIVVVINASLEEEERSRDFSKQIMDNPESIPVDQKANEQDGETIACIQEIGTISETKVDDNKFKTEEMTKEFLQKPFSKPVEFENHLTAGKGLTADGDIEKAAKEEGEQKISCDSSNTPSMVEGRGMDLATPANEAVDENTNYEVAGHEKTSHEITGTMEATVTANETSLRGNLIDDNSKCEIESSNKVPETTKMTNSTESQAVEIPHVEEAPAFEFLPARAESEEANIGCLPTPKFKKIADERVTESCVGENEARLGLEEEISKEEENAKKENVENISEKEGVPSPLEGVPESLTQVQDCDVISKSEDIEIKEGISGVAKMGIILEGVVLEEEFGPKETIYEANETGETNMSTEKIKDENEDSKEDFTGSYKEEITREIQTENKVDQDVQKVCEVIETTKGNEEVSKVFEDPNDTQNISITVACNDNAVAELGGNLESIDVSLNQTAQGKSIKEFSTLLDTEKEVHDLESSRSECEKSIEKTESSANEFQDKRSTTDDLDNQKIKESKISAADAAKEELPGKPDICTVSQPATKPSYETLEHYEDNRGYLKPIVRPQPEDSESKQLVPEFSEEKESEKWDDKNEISFSDKVELEEDTLTLSSEKTDEKTSITDNWNIITGNKDGKPCIKAEKLDLSTDKQVSPQADHIEKILAPEKKNSTESSLVKGGDSETSSFEKEEPSCGNEEQQIKEATKSMEEPETEDVDKPSLEDIHQVSTKAIDPIADCSTGEEPAMSKEELYEKKSNKTKHEESKAGEEHDEEEELCAQHKSDSSSEAPVMVDVGDADVKHTHKKSHNILSGVGSKVKHSLAKVKKAITGKPSHPKPPSPK